MSKQLDALMDAAFALGKEQGESTLNAWAYGYDQSYATEFNVSASTLATMTPQQEDGKYIESAFNQGFRRGAEIAYGQLPTSRK